MRAELQPALAGARVSAARVIRRGGRWLLLLAGTAVLGAVAGTASGLAAFLTIMAIYGGSVTLESLYGVLIMVAVFSAPLGAVLGPIARVTVSRPRLSHLTLLLMAATYVGALCAALLAVLLEYVEATLVLMIPGGVVGYALALGGCRLRQNRSPASAHPEMRQQHS